MDSIEQRTPIIFTVPERRDNAQTVIFDKLKRGRDVVVPTIQRRVEMAGVTWGVTFFLAQPITFPKIYTPPLRNGPGHFVNSQLPVEF